MMGEAEPVLDRGVDPVEGERLGVDGERWAQRRSRRELLRMIGAAAGLGAVGLSAPDLAGAANGQNVVLGNNDTTNNAATARTNLNLAVNDDAGFAALNAGTTTTVRTAGLAGFNPQNTSSGIGVYGSSGYDGVYGDVNPANAFGNGVHGYSSNGTGVWGEADADKIGTGVFGSGSYGGFFAGSVNSVTLAAQSFAGPPTPSIIAAGGGASAVKGDMLVDSTGILWLCIAAGVPGTWIKVSHGGVRSLSSPVRAYDSRDGGGKLSGGAVAGTAGTPRPVNVLVNGVDPNAVSVFGNLTTTEQEASGFATIWPSGPFPGTSNINFTAGVDIANSFTVGVSGGTVQVAASASTHFIVDIAGYIL